MKDKKGLMKGLGGLLDGKKDHPKGEYYLPKGIKRTKTAIQGRKIQGGTRKANE